MVATPEPTSLSDAYATIKVLSAQQGRANFNLAINQTPQGIDGRTVARQLQSIADRFLPPALGHPVALEFAGSIPSDPEVVRSVRARVPIVLNAPQCGAAIALEDLARTLASQTQRLRGLRPQEESQEPARMLLKKTA